MASALRLRPLRALPSLSSSRAIAPTRPFHASRVTLAGKESALHEDPDARKSKIEQQKQDQLRDSWANHGEWRDELASDSESVVKADRGDIKDAKSTIKELQDETAKVAEQDRREGKN